MASSPQNRNRSSSCSSPLRKKVMYQEMFSVGKNTVIRSFSCGQFFKKNKHGQTFEATQIQISNFVTPTKKLGQIDSEFDRKAWSVPKRITRDYASAQEPNQSRMRLTYDAADQIVKNVHECEKLSVLPSSNTSVPCIFISSSIIFLISLMLVLSSTNYLTQIKCTNEWDINGITENLRNLVFGQDEAVKKILDLLYTFDVKKQPLILTFTGNVGVGKTYTSSLISKNFAWSSINHISFLNLLTAKNYKLLVGELAACGYNLVIVDDISVLECETATNLVTSAIRHSTSSQKLIIILIFQVLANEEENRKLKKCFQSIPQSYQIQFQDLLAHDVLQCFHVEASRLNVNIPPTELKKLVEAQMNFIGILNGSPGCKGVSDEISSFVKQV